MQIDNYQKIRLLGEGTYGKCYLALNKQNNQHCVLKQIQIIGLAQDQINQSVRQAHILQALDSEFIIKFLGSFQSKDGHLNIIMSFAEGGDLCQKIKEIKINNQVFPEEQILTWFTQICLAIKHVHDRKIIHRDLKTQNIFLTKNGDVKLGDFGIAKHLQHTIQKIKSVVGTPYYMSPEICENKEYSFKADIWSLGVILLEMCLLKPPFDANSLPVLALKISKGEHFPVPKYYSRELKKLVAQLLQLQPSKRPSIAQVLKNPLIQPRITHLMSKQTRQQQFSHTTLHAINIFDKKPSRGLFIECNNYSNSIQNVASPKSYSQISGNKHLDMPVSYGKEQAKIPADKKSKKAEVLKKRQISEPNLTPKNHVKIQNQRKLLAKNNSSFNFQKKKGSSKQGIFKKKSKDVLNPQSQVQQIRQLRNQIIEFNQQFSHRARIIQQRQLQNDELNQIQESNDSPQKEQKLSVEPIEKQESILQTLQSILSQYTKQSDFSEFYNNCEKNSGIYVLGPCAGLVTLAYAFKQSLKQ